MSTHRASRLGIAVLSAVALVASGASPVSAQAPDPGKTPLTVPVVPGGLAVDSAGSVYVTQWGGGAGTKVSVFDPGATTENPGRTLTGASGPIDVRIRAATGEVFVADYNTDSILVYDPATTTPNPAKTRCCVPEPTGVTFSESGNLLVSSWTAHAIYVFYGAQLTPGMQFPTASMPIGIEVQPGSGDLFVPSYGDDSVQVFDKGVTTPNAAKSASGLSAPYGIAFHPNTGVAYVSQFGADIVSVFPKGIVAVPASDTLTGLDGPRGVAANPVSGEVLVADSARRVLAYTPVPTINAVTPSSGPITGGGVVTITGTNLDRITSVAFGGAAAALTARPVEFSTVEVVAPRVTSAGVVPVTVTGAGLTATKADGYTFTPVAPGKATGVSGAPGNGQVTVSWTPPADTGGVPVASYTVTPTPAGPACATAATSCTIAGLTNGTKYKFVVRTTNTANLSTDSDTSAEVTPYVPIKQTVKAKKASSKLPRKGFTTVVNWVKKPSYASRVMTATCTDGTARTTGQLCRIYSYKTGKVKVRTKGYRNVRVTITLQLIPKVGAPVQYGPSATWTRTWRVR